MEYITIANALRRAKRIVRPAEWDSEVLPLVDKTLDGHGVEPIRDCNARCVAEYVNTGDTYCRTLIFDRLTNRFCIESMGDFIERKERAPRTRYGFRAA
jgi:hypothetical protein